MPASKQKRKNKYRTPCYSSLEMRQLLLVRGDSKGADPETVISAAASTGEHWTVWRDSESEQDFLNFTEVAEQIATLATNPNLLSISIGVFGTWGTGKSTVLRLVEARLDKLRDGGEKAGVPIVVKFDAWMYQGFDDARAALMEVVASNLLKLAEEKKTFVDKAKEFAGRVNYFRGLGMIADFGIGMALGIPPGLLTRAGAAVSSAFAGNVTEEQYGELKKDAVEAKKGMTELIKPAEKRTPPKEIEAFRKEFGELLEGLNTSLVLFIDNLDRCLPDVAIGTLEAIRLFLFMPQTAFVIAADEDMVRHSVAKHFNDPNASHVRDYLDKVIQVPMRVPQVGAEDLRAYMYSLFIGLAAPDKLIVVQERLLGALQGGWKGDSFDKTEILEARRGPSRTPRQSGHRRPARTHDGRCAQDPGQPPHCEASAELRLLATDPRCQSAYEC